MTINYATWMQRLLPLIGDTPINRLVLPECHDSGTAEITTKSDVSPDEPRWMDNVAKIPCVGSVEKGIIKDWGITQNDTFGGQFDKGIRSFDIRVTTKKINDTVELWTSHGLYSAPLNQQLKELVDCLDENPKEIIILRFDHLYGDALTVRHLLNDLITDNFDYLLVPRSHGPNITVNEVLKLSKQVVATCVDMELVKQNHNLFPPADCPWYNVQTTNDLFAKVEPQISKKFDGFAVTQMILTPNTKTIVNGMFFSLCGKANNLKTFARDHNPTIMAWLKSMSNYSSNLNIINADFVAATDLVDLTIAFNIKNALSHNNDKVSEQDVRNAINKYLNEAPSSNSMFNEPKQKTSNQVMVSACQSKSI